MKENFVRFISFRPTKYPRKVLSFVNNVAGKLINVRSPCSLFWHRGVNEEKVTRFECVFDANICDKIRYPPQKVVHNKIKP